MNKCVSNFQVVNSVHILPLRPVIPSGVVEWIPYNNLENINYLTKGGFSEIYTAEWINGSYENWDSEKQQLVRFGTEYVILKRLENVESANQSWFEEVCILNLFIKSKNSVLTIEF
jgi:hypothetical protein